MKEYGGYLPFELGSGREYYSGKDVLRLNCARTALITAIRDGGYHKIYIPLYLCESVKLSLEKNHIDYELYHINSGFEPIDVAVGQTECILLVNYYGILSYSKINALVRKYRNVILDNTQSFFSEPVMGAYNIYSCRKFIGVADGAYLVKENLRQVKYEKDISYDRYLFTLKCMEEGTNAAYQGNLENEEYIEKTGLLMMSDLTYRILDSVDYGKIKDRRRKNFEILHGELGEINALEIKIEDLMIPMVYPLLCFDDNLRSVLVGEKHIYVPQWWKWVLGVYGANEFERNLSRYLLPLPIDQRYDSEDMLEIIQIIEKVKENRDGSGTIRV